MHPNFYKALIATLAGGLIFIVMMLTGIVQPRSERVYAINIANAAHRPVENKTCQNMMQATTQQ